MPSTMTDFCPLLGQNHAIKNPIKPKYAPVPRAQYGWAPLLSAKGRMLEGVPFTQQIKVWVLLGRGKSTIIHLNIRLWKILLNQNTCQDSVCNMVNHSCSALRVECWMGSLLHYKSKLGHFLWGEATIIRLIFHVPLLGGIPLFISSMFEFFWMPCGGFLGGPGDIVREYKKNERDHIIHLLNNKYEHRWDNC